ncbi:MAG: YqgE/AlgH family protein [Myxococcota bacterium]
MQPSLLIASPQMRDPNFEKTVVLVWHHDAQGAIGVVVNRPTGHRLDEVLDFPLDRSGRDSGRPPDAPIRTDVPVAWGGPVENGSGTVVTIGAITDDEGWMLPSGLSVTRSHEALTRLLEEGAPMMLCLGYAGWGPGQLDKEIELGGWLWTDCDASIVFGTPPDERYDRALASLGLQAHQVWMQPVNE